MLILKNKLNTISYRILKDKICKYQEIIVNGNAMYLTGAKEKKNEMSNAKQFFFGDHYYNLYETLLKCFADKVPEDEKEGYDKKMIEVYNYIIAKGERQYKECAFAFEKIKQALDFPMLSYNDKIDCLREILKITQANSTMCKYKKNIVNNQLMLQVRKELDELRELSILMIAKEIKVLQYL